MNFSTEKLILNLLRHGENKEAVEFSLSAEDGGQVIDQFKKQGLTVLFWEQHRDSLNPYLADSVWTTWKEQVADIRLRTMAQHRLIKDIQVQAEKQNLSLRFFKGADLAPHLYKDPAQRPMADIDVLVDKKHLRKTIRFFKQEGFQLPEKHLPVWLSSLFHYHIAMHHNDTGAMIEIHWNLGEKDIQIDDPVQYAIYLALHIYRHTWCLPLINQNGDDHQRLLHPWQDVRLIWFVDLKLFLYHRELSTQQILEEAQQRGYIFETQEVLTTLSRIFPGITSPEPVSSGQTQSRIRQKLDRLIFKRLQGQPPAKKPWFLRLQTGVHLRPIQILYRWV